jgi:hypothetical protein
MLIVVAAMVTALSAACGGTGTPDPDDMMGPGNMGDDDMMMRVSAVDTSSVRL